jgi:hypothetical protein
VNNRKQVLKLLCQIFFVDPYRRTNLELCQSCLYRANKTCHTKTSNLGQKFVARLNKFATFEYTLVLKLYCISLPLPIQCCFPTFLLHVTFCLYNMLNPKYRRNVNIELGGGGGLENAQNIITVLRFMAKIACSSSATGLRQNSGCPGMFIGVTQGVPEGCL